MIFLEDIMDYEQLCMSLEELEKRLKYTKNSDQTSINNLASTV